MIKVFGIDEGQTFALFRGMPNSCTYMEDRVNRQKECASIGATSPTFGSWIYPRCRHIQTFGPRLLIE